MKRAVRTSLQLILKDGWVRNPLKPCIYSVLLHAVQKGEVVATYAYECGMFTLDDGKTPDGELPRVLAGLRPPRQFWLYRGSFGYSANGTERSNLENKLAPLRKKHPRSTVAAL